jgi:hypothetical protein
MTTEMIMTINDFTDKHEIRWHDNYHKIVEGGSLYSEVKNWLWGMFMKQIGSYLENKNLYLIKFIGYRQEGKHDLILEYTLKTYK